MIDIIFAQAARIEHIDTAMIIGCYIAVGGHIVWSFKSIMSMRDMLFMHENKSEIHPHTKDIMFKDVCDERMARIDDKIITIQSDISDIKVSLNKGFDKLTKLIESK